jgi:hypothetical protein
MVDTCNMEAGRPTLGALLALLRVLTQGTNASLHAGGRSAPAFLACSDPGCMMAPYGCAGAPMAREQNFMSGHVPAARMPSLAFYGAKTDQHSRRSNVICDRRMKYLQVLCRYSWCG